EILLEFERRSGTDWVRRRAEAVGIADERAADDGPVLRACSRQGPDRAADFVERREALILLRRSDVIDVKRIAAFAAELEDVVACAEHGAVDHRARSKRQRHRARTGREGKIDRYAAGAGDRTGIEHVTVDDRNIHRGGITEHDARHADDGSAAL